MTINLMGTAHNSDFSTANIPVQTRMLHLCQAPLIIIDNVIYANQTTLRKLIKMYASAYNTNMMVRMIIDQ